MGNKLSYKEIDSIKKWTSIEFEYRKIKAILDNSFREKFPDEDFKRYEEVANNLLNVFDKIEDDLGDRVIYRGDIIENSGSSEKEIYQIYLNNNIGDVISLGESILSFSLHRHVAENAPTASDDYRGKFTPTVLYILTERKSKYINIAKYSDVVWENEVLCGIKKKFKVEKIVKYPDRNHLEYYIIEI